VCDGILRFDEYPTFLVGVAECRGGFFFPLLNQPCFVIGIPIFLLELKLRP